MDETEELDSSIDGLTSEAKPEVKPAVQPNKATFTRRMTMLSQKNNARNMEVVEEFKEFINIAWENKAKIE